MSLGRWIPTREQLRDSRVLRPFVHHLTDERLWHMTRHSVARAVAIGLFFGLMLPFAQFLFAVVTAIVLRANVALSAAFTLVTNPFTFPPIYWAAYKLGGRILDVDGIDTGRAAARAQRNVERLAEDVTWLGASWEWVTSAGAPLFTGLAVMACTAAIVGYLLAWVLWRPRTPPSKPR
jgi:uncharacterized protein (DUF2062 family)